MFTSRPVDMSFEIGGALISTSLDFFSFFDKIKKKGLDEEKPLCYIMTVALMKDRGSRGAQDVP